MASDLRTRQEAEWQILHDRVAEVLERHGKIDAFGKGDYWLVDENLGLWRQKVEVQNLNLLKPSIVKQLQDLLADYPDWEITVRVDIVGQEDTLPPMGLLIASDELFDDLQRDFLPPEFRNFTYPGSKPPPWSS
jgi:hypothetical protein